MMLLLLHQAGLCEDQSALFYGRRNFGLCVGSRQTCVRGRVETAASGESYRGIQCGNCYKRYDIRGRILLSLCETRVKLESEEGWKLLPPTGDRSVPKICTSGEMLSHPKLSHSPG